MLSHHIHECQRARYIIVVIFPWLLNGLAHRFQTRKVNAGIDLFVLEYILHRVPVKNVRFVERDRFPRDLLHTLQRFDTRVGQVIHHDYIITCILKFYNCVAADKSGTARN